MTATSAPCGLYHSLPFLQILPDKCRQQLIRLNSPSQPRTLLGGGLQPDVGLSGPQQRPWKGIWSFSLLLYDILPSHSSFLSMPIRPPPALAWLTNALCLHWDNARCPVCVTHRSSCCGYRNESRGPSPCPMDVTCNPVQLCGQSELTESQGRYSNSSSMTTSQTGEDTGAAGA